MGDSGGDQPTNEVDVGEHDRPLRHECTLELFFCSLGHLRVNSSAGQLRSVYRFNLVETQSSEEHLHQILNTIENTLKNVQKKEERYYNMLRIYENKIYSTKWVKVVVDLLFMTNVFLHNYLKFKQSIFYKVKI